MRNSGRASLCPTRGLVSCSSQRYKSLTRLGGNATKATARTRPERQHRSRVGIIVLICIQPPLGLVEALGRSQPSSRSPRLGGRGSKLGLDNEIVHVIQALDAWCSEDVDSRRYSMPEDYNILRLPTMPRRSRQGDPYKFLDTCLGIGMLRRNDRMVRRQVMSVRSGPKLQQCCAELALLVLIGREVFHIPLSSVLRCLVAPCKDM